jgi:glucan biosynthesis protein C
MKIIGNHESGDGRFEFLDWLRVLAILALLFFHTGMLFVGWGWHLTNEETIPWLQLPMDLAHRLRMPLLFVVAGAGMWYALQRRSVGEFTRERALRLLLPLVAGMFLIVPPQVFAERVASGDWSQGYWRFFIERVLQFQPYPQGDFSWHHLWFIAYLFSYVLVLLPVMWWWRRAQPRLSPGPWIFALGLPLGINEMFLKPLFPESHDLISDWYIFNHYLLLTFFGYMLASMRGTWDWLAAQRRWSLGLGLTVIVGGLTLIETGFIERDTPADAVLANVFTWAWLMVFLGFGRHYLSFGSRLLRWSRDASYPVYILHQTVIIGIAFFVIRQPWSPGVKYWLVLAGTLVTCVLLYEFAVRRFALLRLLFGLKPAAGAHPRTAVTSRTAAS